MLTFDPGSHIYRWNDQPVPSITQILKDEGFYPPYAGTAGRDMGTAVHRVCELYDNGNLDESKTSPALLPYLDGYKKMLADLKPEYEVIEKQFYSETHRFAGTPDRYGVMKGKKVVIDLKRTTGDPPVDATSLQTAAQAILMGDREAQRFAMLLRPGTYKLIQYSDPSDYEDWIALVRTWHRKHRKRSS